MQKFFLDNKNRVFGLTPKTRLYLFSQKEIDEDEDEDAAVDAQYAA